MGTRYSFISLDGEAGATENTRAAAAIYALDMPLDKRRTLSTITGDGISGMRVTWHFAKENAHQQSSEAMIRAWDDREYHAKNPHCPLVNIKAAFLRKDELSNGARERTIQPFAPSGPFIETNDTAKAAAMERLGHQMTGIAYRDGKYWWRFSQAAATDFALWDLPSGELERRLPEAMISFLWCAFDSHRAMVDFIKREGAQFAAVQHKGRTAVIGKDMTAAQTEPLERLLYRR